MGLLAGPRRRKKMGEECCVILIFIVLCRLTLEYLSSQERKWLVFKLLRS